MQLMHNYEFITQQISTARPIVIFSCKSTISLILLLVFDNHSISHDNNDNKVIKLYKTIQIIKSR